MLKRIRVRRTCREADMADRKANGRSHRSNGAAVEVPDVHPATYNPRGRKDAGKKANGNKNGVVANVPRERLQFNCAKCPGYCCS
jgi:hypothetical protein